VKLGDELGAPHGERSLPGHGSRTALPLAPAGALRTPIPQRSREHQSTPFVSARAAGPPHPPTRPRAQRFWVKPRVARGMKLGQQPRRPAGQRTLRRDDALHAGAGGLPARRATSSRGTVGHHRLPIMTAQRNVRGGERTERPSPVKVIEEPRCRRRARPLRTPGRSTAARPLRHAEDAFVFSEVDPGSCDRSGSAFSVATSVGYFMKFPLSLCDSRSSSTDAFETASAAAQIHQRRRVERTVPQRQAIRGACRRIDQPAHSLPRIVGSPRLTRRPFAPALPPEGP
jgi:hypothetical protein